MALARPRCGLLDIQRAPEKRLLEGLFELRTIVEPAAAQLAASRRTAGQLRSLRMALDRMAASTLTVEEGRQADRDFHSILLEASGNLFLASLTSGIAAAVNWTTIFKQRNGPLPRDPLPDHERVYRAVAARDNAAAHVAMTEIVRLALLDTTRVRSGRAAGRATARSAGWCRSRDKPLLGQRAGSAAAPQRVEQHVDLARPRQKVRSRRYRLRSDRCSVGAARPHVGRRRPADANRQGAGD